MKRRRKSTSKNLDSSAAAGESPPSAADFSFSLTRVAVSQICRSVGLRAAERSALDTLTIIATKYMQRLAGDGASLSNTASRTESNLFDVLNALRDISSSNPFTGGSVTDENCLIRSNNLRELSDFVSSTLEIPFTKPVPRRRPSRDVSRVPHAPPKASHVPAWLPAFPEASLYRESCCVKQRSDHLWEDSDSVRDRLSSDGVTPQEMPKSNGCGGRYGGELPERREKVRFMLGKKALTAAARVETVNRRSKNDEIQETGSA